MNKDMLENNVDKNIKYGFFGKKFPIVLIGLILLTLAIIPFFNSNGFSSLILFCLSYVFGSFSFLFLSIQALFGIYLMFKMEFVKPKASFTYLGLILLFISGCICSSLSVENLNFTNFLDAYNSNFALVLETPIKISNLGDVCKLSGGFIGYFFSSLFITGLGKIATSVFAGLFLFVGVVICLRKPIVAFYAFIKSIVEIRERKRQEKKSKEKEVENQEAKKLEEVSNSVSPFSSSSGNNFKEVKNEDNQQLKDANKQIKRNIFSPNNEQETDFVRKENQESVTPSPFATSELNKEENFKFEPIKEENININEEKEITSNPFSSTSSFSKDTSQTIFDNQFENEKVNKEPSVNKEEFKKENEYKPNTSNPFSSSSPFSNSSLNQNNTNSSINPPPQSLHKSMVIKHYILPSSDLLSTQNDISKMNINVEANEKKKEVIDEVFRKLKIGASVRDYTIGPSVTRFNIIREDGVKVSEIAKNDVLSELQIDLGGDKSVRIEPVVKGETTSGVEISNVAPMMVSFKECFNSVSPTDAKTIFPLGKDISNKVVKVSLDDLPHLLVSGTTGSGKSVFIHSIIMTLIMRNYPDELKLILVDPKMVEFSKYRDMPHLFCPVVTNITQAVSMLKKLCEEMDRRFQIFATFGASNISEYNSLRKDKPNLEVMPRVVCIIDEFADMMGQDPKNVESHTQRLAQKARACGIYLIIATQRPSVNCITGTIKANIPARIALMLPSRMDSSTILDEGGAEALIGKGDLLAKIPSLKATIRVQSAFVKNEDILQVVNYLKQQCEPSYDPNFLNFTKGEEVVGKLDGHVSFAGYEDELYQTCKDYVINNGVASTSNLQRRFQIGYSRAASILDALEDEGIIKTTANNRKEVIVKPNKEEN